MRNLAIGLVAGLAVGGTAEAADAPVGVWCLGGSPTQGFVSLGLSRVF